MTDKSTAESFGVDQEGVRSAHLSTARTEAPLSDPLDAALAIELASIDLEAATGIERDLFRRALMNVLQGKAPADPMRLTRADVKRLRQGDWETAKRIADIIEALLITEPIGFTRADVALLKDSAGLWRAAGEHSFLDKRKGEPRAVALLDLAARIE